MKSTSKRLGKQSGQGMTEYIIIVSLIAIACIAVVAVFGDNIRKMFGASVNAMAASSTPTTGAAKAADTSNHRNVVNFARHGGG